MKVDRLSAQEALILEYLLTEDGQGDLVWAQPGGWWYGTHRTSGAVCFSLLRKVYISVSWDEAEKSGSTYYRINESGQQALLAHEKGEPFVPPIDYEMYLRSKAVQKEAEDHHQKMVDHSRRF